MFRTLLYIIAFLLPVLSSAQENLKSSLLQVLKDSPLGGMEGATSTVGMEFYDLTTDTTLFAYNEHLMLRPASTMKLTTAIAALDILGGNYKFLTSLKIAPATHTPQDILTTSPHLGGCVFGGGSGYISIIGGMDPCFDSTDMHAFIDTLLNMHIDTIYAPILEDKILKDTLLLGSGWCWDDKNPQLTPLLYNGNNTFLQSFKDSLIANNISIIPSSTIQHITPNIQHLIYLTRSHTIDQVLQPMLKNSNNLYAEALFYQLSPTNRRSPLFQSTGHYKKLPLRGQSGTTAQEITYLLDSLITQNILNGTPFGGRVTDGSGLSLYNYQSADYQVRLLRYAYQHPGIYSHLYPALPIAGVDGTLKSRMTGTPAEGNVHAKTGTVTGVTSLAGYLTASNGHLICFSIINQGCLLSKSARDFQDRLCVMMCETAP